MPSSAFAEWKSVTKRKHRFVCSNSAANNKYKLGSRDCDNQTSGTFRIELYFLQFLRRNKIKVRIRDRAITNAGVAKATANQAGTVLHGTGDNPERVSGHSEMEMLARLWTAGF